MSSIIRKISVGKDFPDKVIYYQIGKPVKLSNDVYKISSILLDKDLMSLGKLAYNVYISNSHETLLWKTIVDQSVVVENNLEFN